MANVITFPNDAWWKNLYWYVIGERAGGVCERCHVRFATQVHHWTYPTGRREQARDLIAVCDECHCKLHNLVAANDNHADEVEELDFG